MSSNWREATAVTRACAHFRRHLLQLRALRVRSDNSTTVSILRRLGSRHRHLDLTMQPVIALVLRSGLHILPEHIAGELNETADRLSRNLVDRNEWRLTPAAMATIRRRLGVPTCDWFATARTTQCARYGALSSYDTTATYRDAMRCDWRNEALGLFVPPFNLILEVMLRLDSMAPHVHGIVVVPDWPSAPWASLLPWRQPPIRLPPSSIAPAPSSPAMRDGRSPPLLAFRI